MSQRRALFYAVFRPFSRATEGGENSSVPAHVDGVIPPMPGRDHPSVQVHDPHQFDPVKTGLDCAAALYWKRRDIRHQDRSRSCMPFAGGSFVWSLRSSISSAMRLRIRSEEHTS